MRSERWARASIIASAADIHQGRVRRHAEAVAERGDHVDLLSLDQAGVVLNRVNSRLGNSHYRGVSRKPATLATMYASPHPQLPRHST